MESKILKYKWTEAPFNNLCFLARPLRTYKDDQRFHINHFLVEKDRSAVSTNGSVLHLVNRVPLVAGFYKVNKLHKRLIEIEFVSTKKDSEFTYPEYIDILGEASKEDGNLVNISIDSDNELFYSIALALIVRAMESNCMDIRWLKLLTDGCWTGYVREEQPSHFSQDERIALIMASRM
jgi:hypothetical protein